ncbi:AAA family ATPase [Actinokineospora globicatena]|uniref:ATPase AAA n=1 Tax=Actinokineospora globicatena TaxID=103729 RepID=A0A9W6QJS0_9PSEU|nr:AAA family ATPase [Actinokineospora globicatena]MCP2302763.1 AAA domain (dynein-related subfamily) [Actinokineospora globicatena]GLW75547.1 ATPase AAA [Actinokineospora globicatena]GLW82388.1 ATPase AAA [Actinokineospora globicatena]GLW91331.1 ATPase AAA [Actinokineospora globicatena]
MTWARYYRGDGERRREVLPDPPPWRTFPRRSLHARFQPPPGLVDAVNAAVLLRRPLLVAGAAGSGKSTIIEQVAHELDLGQVLRWHITSRSTLREALYRYDALGRVHAQNLRREGIGHDQDDIADFLRLGPLGTALLPSERPRALLIDEIDKSDLDLPSDLLDVLERGEFEIPELARHAVADVAVRHWDSQETAVVSSGRVTCTEFPFIVLTSNDERDFPPAFLRRCVRFTMPRPGVAELREIVAAHLDVDPTAGPVGELVEAFAQRLADNDVLAVDQLLNVIHLVADGADTEGLRQLLLRSLSHG